MCSRQPVVTTVFYEHPEADSGKELVLWRPALNWDTKGGVYSAARALSTPHGCVHIQRAGLQSKAKHGVFRHPAAADERAGYRIAITARMTKLDANEQVMTHRDKQPPSYCRQLGPHGVFFLPPHCGTPAE